MSCDLLIGLNEARLNLVLGQVYASPALRQSLFSGSASGDYSGVSFTATWSVGSAPTVSLRPPETAEWSAAIKAGGNPVAPQAGAFIANISSLSLKLHAGSQDLTTNVPVKAICAIAANGNTLSASALGVIVDLSKSSPLDKYMISNVLVPNILGMLSKALSGLTVPSLSFAGLSFTPPVVEIRNSYLLTAFNLVTSGTPSSAGVAIPGDPFFAVASRVLVQSAVDHEVRTNVQGKQFNKSGSEGGGGFSADYSVAGSIAGISAATTTNPLKLHANLSLNMSASAGISLGPLGPVVKILDPSNWDPTRW